METCSRCFCFHKLIPNLTLCLVLVYCFLSLPRSRKRLDVKDNL